MKLPRNALIWCVLIVCITLLIFTYLTRNRLCEVRVTVSFKPSFASLSCFRY
ncbi:Hok/Gef family protein [Escherichia coli]|uniref:Hok/Gef family protein n=1 Tax=Escherichia coli TaxID=562 RepID=UPI000BE3A490|nr:Hok/Gef family protein [Escherichia coli]